jgi:hypothetical protein
MQNSQRINIRTIQPNTYKKQIIKINKGKNKQKETKKSKNVREVYYDHVKLKFQEKLRMKNFRDVKKYLQTNSEIDRMMNQYYRENTDSHYKVEE